MATPASAQDISSQIRDLQSRVSDLQGKVRLTALRDAVEDLQSTVNGMAQRIAGLRTTGYVFEKDLEGQAKAFVEAWAMLYPNVQMQINTQATNLQNTLRPIELQMPQLAAAAANPGVAQGLLRTLQSAADGVESNADAAERSIQGMYDQFQNQVSTLARHLDDVEYLLKQLAEATFQLMPTEAGIAAVKAVWCKTGKEQKDDPEGVLYLTDQRLIFEQKEEVATKKVLFIATEKQKVQNLQLETPVALAEKVDTSKQGLLKNEDHIEIHFGSGAPFELVHFHIWRDAAVWQGLINRAKTKDFDAGRAVAVDQAAVAKVKAAPAQCPSCGGNLTKPVLRGQDSITCEYCGFVIRL
jgi:chromosome segregation ATPase